MDLTHVNTSTGDITMVNVGNKEIMDRTASAYCRVEMQASTITLIRKGLSKKGDVLACARIAGIMAAKQTSSLIPLCHQIPLDSIGVEFVMYDEAIEVNATAECRWTTGVEMEALTAVSVAALTLYDMCKAADKAIHITDIHLVKKDKVKIV